MTNDHVSEKIKDLIDSRGKTQAEVAADMNMQPTLLSRMLRNKNHNYTVKMLSRIANAVGADLTVEFSNPDRRKIKT